MPTSTYYELHIFARSIAAACLSMAAASAHAATDCSETATSGVATIKTSYVTCSFENTRVEVTTQGEATETQVDTLTLSGEKNETSSDSIVRVTTAELDSAASAFIDTLEINGVFTAATAAGIAVMPAGNDGTAEIGAINNLAGAEINSTYVYGIYVYGPGYVSKSAVGTINNRGKITGAYTGISVSNENAEVGAIDNKGTIVGVNRAGIMADTSAKITSIQNTGTISGAKGIFTDSGGSIGEIINSAGGVITGTDGTAIDLSSSSGDTAITNAGRIEGKVTLSADPPIPAFAFAPPPRRILNLEDNSVVTGEVTGIAGSEVNVLGGFSTSNTFSVDTFNIDAHARLTMGHDIAVQGADGLKNEGTLFVPAGKRVSIDGNYVQGANGVFQTGVNGTAGSTEYGQLHVMGNADLSASSKIAVWVTSADTIKSGALPGILQADGTLTVGTLGVTVEDSSALWDFTAVKNGASIDLTAQLAPVPPGPGPEPGPSPGPEPGPDPTPEPGKGTAAMIESTGLGLPALGAAHVIDQFLFAGNATGDMQTVLNNLGALSTQQDVALAVSQMIPVMTGEMAQISLGAMQSTNRVVQARLEAARGLSSGDGVATAHGWIKPFGSWANQSDRDGVAGYRSDTYGFVLGADKEVGRATRLGAAFSYANTKLNGHTNMSAKVDAYQVIFYGSHSLDARTEVNFQADAGMNRNCTNRSIRFADLNRNARADYDSWNTHLGLGLGRQFDLSPKAIFTPSLRADYLYVRDRAYTESGADALNLGVDSHSTDALILALDGKVNYALSDAVDLSANVGLGYDALASRSSITSTFVGGGAAFVTRGTGPAPWLVRGGVGLSTTYANGLELALRYDVEGRKSFTNQTASLRLRMPF